MLRDATLNDADDIAQVHVEAWQTAYRDILPDTFLDGLSVEDRRERWLTILSKDAPQEFNFVAESNGKVVGFASGGPLRGEGHAATGEIYAMYVANKFRRCGIGTGLFAKAIDTFRGQSMSSMKVFVLKDNPYKSFYLRHGGVLAGEEKIRIAGLDLIQIAFEWSVLPASCCIVGGR